jgi:hypothetical protein
MFHHPRATPLLAAVAFGLAACSPDSPVEATSHAHHSGLSLASVAQAASAKTLSDLTRLTAPFHDVDKAEAVGYALFTLTPLTAPDGCISSTTDGGMGYHYTRGNNLGDDSVTLLDPEFLVYAPKNGPRKDGEARRRLAAFDYFIPYSAKWPGPNDATFTRAPTLHDFSTMSELPDLAFAPSRFNGWMFHIWLWENNPGGMFANWNTSVPLCDGSAF